MSSDPEAQANDIVTDRFYDNIERGGDDECWLWTGPVGGDGNGVFNKGKQASYSVRRLAYNLWADDTIPIAAEREGVETTYVLSACDEGLCVNPAHLEVHEGRMPTSKLTADDAVEIRERVANGEYDTYETLADKYNVDKTTVGHTVRGNVWADAGGPIRGEDTRRKLSDAEVREIRESYDETSVSRRDLASDYDVSSTHIGAIVNGETRRDAGGPIQRGDGA